MKICVCAIPCKKSEQSNMPKIFSDELYLRLIFFGVVFLGLAFWETKANWRQNLLNRQVRWLTHLGLGGLSFFLVRLFFPLLALNTAMLAETQAIGLFQTSPVAHLPLGLKILLSLLGMDFAMYMQHRWMHRYAIFWRVHRVHHTDTELDLSTGIRFHPIEYFFMMGVKILAILFLGIPVMAAFIFEVMLSSFSLFNHSNIQLPARLEKYLSIIFVTPKMHRIHHSDIPFEQNHNFGFCFSVWDKISQRYLAEAHQGQAHLVFGLEIYRAPAFQTLQRLLALPFLRHKALKPHRNKTVSFL